MKKTMILAMALGLFLASCSDTESLVGVATSSSSAAQVKAYVSDHFADANITSISTEGNYTMCILNTGEILTFDNQGNLMNRANATSGIAVDSIRVCTGDSSTVSHMGRPGNKGGRKGHSGRTGMGGMNRDSIFAHISDSALAHMSDSAFVHIGGRQHRDSIHGFIKGGKGFHHDPIEIPLDSLPAAIAQYIIDNYNGYKVLASHVDTTCSATYTKIMVATDGVEPLKLYFDADGNYTMKSVRILSSSLPENITTAAATYTDYTLPKSSELVTLADGTTLQYKIYLRSTTNRLKIWFDADANVICEY